MISRTTAKFIKSLKIKKFRSLEGAFLVEGGKNVLELITSDFEIRTILATQNFIDKNENFLSSVRGSIEVVSTDELQSLGTLTTNQECLAVAGTKTYSVEDITFDDHLFVLDGVRDPGNLGTIIRTLDWFGFRQLLCSPDTAEWYNPKVVSSSKGSFTRVRVIYAPLQEVLSKSFLPVYVTDLQGVSIRQHAVTGPSIMVMGSEARGASSEIHNLAAGAITIPKFGKAESLNVAIAAGIICHHLRSAE